MFSASSDHPSSPDIPELLPDPVPADSLPAGSAFRRALPRIVLLAVVPAVLGTAVLPASAALPSAHAVVAAAPAEGQSFEFAAPVDAPVVAERDGYTGVSAAEMAAAAAAAQRAAYGGPRVGDLLANPPYPNYDLNTIVSIAMQYQGVPYVYGGSTPAGFDCSGFTQFVFAHVGIALPHSSSAQGRMTAIAPEAALPGDLVILDGGGHVGIYVGGGRMIDAPRPGGVVSVRPMWGSYWFVRPGI